MNGRSLLGLHRLEPAGLCFGGFVIASASGRRGLYMCEWAKQPPRTSIVGSTLCAECVEGPLASCRIDLLAFC